MEINSYHITKIQHSCRFHRGKGTVSYQNLHSFNPFADASKDDDLLPAGTEHYIHVRIQQRNGRKTLTTVQGIADDYDKKKLVKAFKKKFACNGTVIEHPEHGEVIQLQGDQCKNICQFLIEIGLAKDDQMKISWVLSAWTLKLKRGFPCNE
ncbi:eukaryotic translation initiation factor 1-like [Microtus oregoni]|uniref:eukaryotic translation initiation factor 1-like n=1 Tax=Microtus oregoni TaxID=111838 RepID=UPI001BB146A2|nr:eukaryotic translation initiation factor 1-like [Microtus oregoni]